MWEYMSDWITYKSHPELIEELNELGKDGWELCYYWAGDATVLNEEHAFIILKRKSISHLEKLVSWYEAVLAEISYKVLKDAESSAQALHNLQKPEGTRF